MLTYLLQETGLPIDVGHLGGPVVICLLLLLCVVCVGLFSSSEAALISVNKLKIHTLAAKGHKGALAVERLVQHHERLFSTILTTENMFVILASTFAGAIGAYYFGAIGTGVAAVVMTIFIVVFGEIVPKTLAANHAERVSLFVARPMETITRLMSPVVWVFSTLAHALVRLTGTRSGGETQSLSEDEIKMAVTRGALEHDEKELIHTIFEFGDTVAHEVMVPRVDMVCVEAKAPLQKGLELINQTGHSRIPVYGENIDDIVGILHAKDVLLKVARLGEDLKVEDVMRQKRVFAPQGQKIVALLSKLQAERSSIAIVIDEYGGTAGLVTIEKLLEEIVGDIEDEFDIVEKADVAQEDRIRHLDARTPLDEVNEELQLKLPEGDYNSLGGFLTHHMGKIPSEGEEFAFDGVRFIVAKTHHYKLRTITLVLPEEQEQPQKDGQPA